ncbi:MAG: IMP cyclohydrolase [Bacillota bacterium]|nr:IMP cyclohydrolase [Bacillota bacterium]
MDIYEIQDTAKLLSSNNYPGRGIIIGKTPNGKKAVVAYFIMGRSENSRNRIFTEKGENVTIYPFDESKVEDPSLIIYSPIRTLENKLIVTNGDQTDTIYDFLEDGKTFEQALDTRKFEPDCPNFTPRISGMLTFENGGFTYKMSILKSADKEGSACNRYYFNYVSTCGVGHFIHTYNSDGNPIPTFTGEPERLQISDDIEEFTQILWNNLNGNNKVSLYVRYIDLDSGKTENRIINKHQK